jgi:hypothetical protein
LIGFSLWEVYSIGRIFINTDLSHAGVFHLVYISGFDAHVEHTSGDGFFVCFFISVAQAGEAYFIFIVFFGEDIEIFYSACPAFNAVTLHTVPPLLLSDFQLEILCFIVVFPALAASDNMNMGTPARAFKEPGNQDIAAVQNYSTNRANPVPVAANAVKAAANVHEPVFPAV